MQTLGLTVLALLALDIWAGVSIVQSHRPTSVKLIWLAVVLFLPVLGLLIWMIAGPKPGRPLR